MGVNKMHDWQPTVQENLHEIRERSHIRISALGGSYVPFWTRLALLYRLLMRANETRVQIQRIPARRQREVALQRFWQDGGDLGS